MGILTKIFGNYSEKELKRIKARVDAINGFEDTISQLSDEELTGKTQEFRTRYENGETLDDLLPEAFAVVREAGKRVLGMRHFDVQLIGGIILHQGRIAEMRTGEGKTLVSTLPAYLNAISGKGVHIVTVNDYLASRDAEWMGQLHSFLGLTVGVVLSNMEPSARRAAYACDITYATNNELGFDYLRDNMVLRKADMVQRGLSYAVIDEVDSVLIDEARTPLIISGSGEKSTKLYEVADAFVKGLTPGRILNEDEAFNPLIRSELEEEGDFVVDEKAKSVTLTRLGVEKAERYFAVENLSDPENLEKQHHINNALKANYNMFRDRDYVVQNEEIIIVDEFTGRLMEGRRYSDGLHQAIEAKEKVKVNRESKTLATITFQNYFNKYDKKSGMTGTAQTEEGEFREIYGMDVVVVPTNKPIQRIDHPDCIYRSERAKINAVVEDIKTCVEKGQPVLVGTISIEKSEELSELLKREGIKHKVLNAKFHEKEAEIVSLAGQVGAVTIATNMAGRGTDIKLEDGVNERGGLKIIGTERHESRRIDNQLRGRAGRQGDPGESRFYISLEDDLMRLFGAGKVMKMIDFFKVDENEALEDKMLSKAIENAQRRVEGNNFAIRKHLLEYDQVMNEQREIIYGERSRVLNGEDVKGNIMSMLKAIIDRSVEIYTGESEFPEEWDLRGLSEHLKPIFNKTILILTEEEKLNLTKEGLKEDIYNQAVEMYDEKEKEIDDASPDGEKGQLREIERRVLLKVIDQRWMDHIDDMDQMRQGINLRAYAQKDPLIEYRFLSYDMFDELGQGIQWDVVRTLFNIRVVRQPEEIKQPTQQPMFTNRGESSVKKPITVTNKVGRNDPCTCGSGKKYKQCCGK